MEVIIQLSFSGLSRKLNDIQFILDKVSAISYYAEAYIFTNWITSPQILGNLKESSLIEVSGLEDEKMSTVKGTQSIFYDFSTKDTNVFDLSVGDASATDYKKLEISKESPFYTHKLNVIRNSIQYNLNYAMSAYNYSTGFAFDYQMPVLNEEEWEKILTNVSLVSFMQGINCGLKAYNNYDIVTSTNNELTVVPSELYYVKKDEFNNEEAIYHKIDCKDFIDNATNTDYIAFPSKEVKYDQVYEKKETSYRYDHKNLACYSCVNDGNYEHKDIFNMEATDPDRPASDIVDSLQRAYYIGVGKTRNNIYKMNSFLDMYGNSLAQGHQTIFFKKEITGEENPNRNNESKLELCNFKEIRVTHDTLFENGDKILYKVIVAGGSGGSSEIITIAEGAITVNAGTLIIPVDPLIGNTYAGARNKKIKFEDLSFVCTKNFHINSTSEDYTAGSSLNNLIRPKITCIEVIYK